MIEHTYDSIFLLPVDAIINPVNCVGVMGAGLAKKFKECYPAYFKDYKELCNQQEIQLGHVYFYRNKPSGKYIISFPTKGHWSEQSSLQTIKEGLVDLHIKAVKKNLKSIAIPHIGCGCGGLTWSDVLHLIFCEFYKTQALKVIICD